MSSLISGGRVSRCCPVDIVSVMSAVHCNAGSVMLDRDEMEEER